MFTSKMSGVSQQNYSQMSRSYSSSSGMRASQNKKMFYQAQEEAINMENSLKRHQLLDQKRQRSEKQQLREQNIRDTNVQHYQAKKQHMVKWESLQSQLNSSNKQSKVRIIALKENLSQSDKIQQRNAKLVGDQHRESQINNIEQKKNIEQETLQNKRGLGLKQQQETINREILIRQKEEMKLSGLSKQNEQFWNSRLPILERSQSVIDESTHKINIIKRQLK